MPVRFRCSSCQQPLSVSSQKCGATITCPRCQNATRVPRVEKSAPVPAAGASSIQNERPQPASAQSAPVVLDQGSINVVQPSSDRTLAIAVVGGILLFLLLAGGGVAAMVAYFALSTDSATDAMAQGSQRIVEPVKPADPIPPNDPNPPVAPPKPKEKEPADGVDNPKPPTGGNDSGNDNPTPQPPPDPNPPRGGETLLVLDDFGNPKGSKVGLALDGEFKGKTILVWCGSKDMIDGFFGEANPLWRALEKKGFRVIREGGVFIPQWLNKVDQLWIISLPKYNSPLTRLLQINAKLVVQKNDAQMRQSLRVMVATDRQRKQLLKKYLVKDDLTKEQVIDELMIGQRDEMKPFATSWFNLSYTDLQAIDRFLSAGKGVFLLAENEPFVYEGKELARLLFGTQIRGNYNGMKLASVRNRSLTPDQINRFCGAFKINDHDLLTGINFLYEGATVSQFSPTASLDVVFRASNGQPLVGVSKIPGKRLVLDCGYTRYVYGRSRMYRMVSGTAGTIRFAENVAAYLMGKTRRGLP